MILEFLQGNESALTYDFQAIHNLRLSDAVTERTTSELFDLILWIPDDSAFRASLEAKGDTSKALSLYGWGTRMELLLASVNLLLDQNYILVQSHSKKTVTPPEHVSGPRDDKNKKPAKTNATAMAYAIMKGGNS